MRGRGPSLRAGRTRFRYAVLGLMNYSIEVRYDRPLVRRALNRFMLDRLGWTSVIGLPVALLFLLLMFLSGSWSLWLSIVAGLLAVAVVTIAYIYYIRLETSEGFFARTKDPTVTFFFTSDAVRTDSELGSSELKWLVFDEILKFRDVWLLIYAEVGI